LCCWCRRRFGVNYASSCSIDLSGLLAQLDFSSNGPRFYDPYLLQVTPSQASHILSPPCTGYLPSNIDKAVQSLMAQGALIPPGSPHT
jgi:hypothetical protein